MGNLQPRFPLLPHGFRSGPGSQAWPRKGSWLSCSWSRLHEGCHTLSAPMCSPNTLFTSQVGFRLCSFYSCFSFRIFFWLVQVRKAISTLRLKAANRACKRAVGVCLLVLVLGRHIHAFSLSASPWFMGIEFLGRLLTRVNSLLALAQRFIYYYI